MLDAVNAFQLEISSVHCFSGPVDWLSRSRQFFPIWHFSMAAGNTAEVNVTESSAEGSAPMNDGAKMIRGWEELRSEPRVPPPHCHRLNYTSDGQSALKESKFFSSRSQSQRRHT